MSENQIKLSGIFSEGYGIIPKRFMRMKLECSPAIERNIKLVMAYMLSYTGAGNTCFPSIDTISSDLAMSRSVVIDSIKKACEMGLIEKAKMFPNDPLRHNNIYTLTFIDASKVQNLNFRVSESKLTTSDNKTFEVVKLDPINNSINNNSINNNNNKEVKIRHLDAVLLTSDEYSKLIEKLGEKEALNYIEKLNNYILSKGKKYKSHYHTILNWVNMAKSSTAVEKKLYEYNRQETF